MSFFSNFENYLEDLIDNFRSDFEVNRREEREYEIDNGLTDETDNTLSGPARILNVDFKAKINAINHKCDKYELVSQKNATAVLRRGGNFLIDFKLSQGVDLKKEYVMKLYFRFGNVPNVHKGTLAILNVTGKKMFDKSHEEWDVRVEESGKTLTLEVQIPTNAPVGTWLVAAELRPRDAPPSEKQMLRIKTGIYILFNPWNKNDGTYMAEEERRQEYVLNDVGKIWQGGYPPHGRHWVFGQFDDVVLPACVVLMERSGVKHEDRGDPVLVSRAVSKMVNSNDDAGVIHGKWSGSYDDGTPPSHWTGSIKIMEEYVTRQRPVRYGQCWVYAGVTTTVCRALGIPCRPVTNLNSAHDTDVSLTIDKYIDKKGDEITPRDYRRGDAIAYGVRDSIWNFHVWNDVWMERPDLEPGYGGWQAIDATPQETSDSVFQCGPASHEAIRRGQLGLKYDVAFVLAEVNADIVHWQEDPDARDGFKKLYSNKNQVGRMVLTKKIAHLNDGGYGGDDHEDCTMQYKPPEGSKAERVTLHTAARGTKRARHAFRFPSEAIEDVNFSIVDIDKIKIGEDFSITLKAENTSEQVRNISIVLKAGSTYYTGAPAKPITQREGDFKLEPMETTSLSLPVPYHKYYDKLVEHAMVKMVAICTVKETSYAWVGDDCFEVMKPDLLVQALSEPVVGRRFKVRFSFSNPLPRVLYDCVLFIDGPGLTRPKKIPLSNVASKGEMISEHTIIPRKPGEFILVATFNSNQLVNLSGSARIKVSE